MKQTYFYLLGLLLAVGTARAQDYRPFRQGLTYQFSESTTPGDTTHVLRLIAGTRVGADSVFRFNGMAQPVAANSNTCYGSHFQRPNNLFGATLTVPVTGGFVLAASNGRTLTLHPRAALNQPWQAAAGLTATVTARSVAAVLGQADSVATISLSNGQMLRLSKRLGVVDGPALIALLDGRYAAHDLSLTAIPELHLGSEPLGSRAVYDYQPQDVFLRYWRSIDAVGGGLCQERWVRDSVLTRAVSANGDSIRYTIWSRYLSIGYGMAGAPIGFCSSTGTYLSPGGVTTLVVTKDSPSTAGPLTNSVVRPGGYQVLSSAGSRTAAFNNRMMQQATMRAICSTAPVLPDSVYLTNSIDYGGYYRMVEGLGVVWSQTGGLGGVDYMELLGYRKNGVTYGQLRSFRQLLPTATAKPAATTAAFPNPFSQELTVQLELSRPQAVALELRDALGRVVLTQPSAPLPAGPAAVRLNTASVPAGLYTLLLKPANGPAQALKVQKQ